MLYEVWCGRCRNGRCDRRFPARRAQRMLLGTPANIKQDLDEIEEEVEKVAEDVEKLLNSSRTLSETDRVILKELQSIEHRLDEVRPEGR
jgi:uncharacterized protein Yka (UPF0111/DUF47 family)